MLITTEEAVKLIFVKTGRRITPQHVRVLCARNVLTASKRGSFWLIESDSIDSYIPQKPGVKKKACN